ncbi:MAG: GNAT family N-acetyltransferase [Kofleriaceae bacterium]|nr:GNAT family N-acetyltransferase [Kofleriaceae bacterium]MCL4223060.1 GNAT family N-acetyltransferase [Myxococcales bacterium]
MSLVRLRPLAESDVDHIMTWVNDPEITGNIAAFSGRAFTRDDEVAYVRQILASPSDRVFSIEEAATGRYLGQTGLHQIHARSKVARLACIIATRGDMGRGYGTGAIRLVLDHAFGPLGLHKLWLMVFSHNERGRRIYGRLGFVEEGVLREEYFHQDRWFDMVRMSMLAREWAARRGDACGPSGAEGGSPAA